METIQEMCAAVRQGKGLRGWLKRRLFGHLLEVMVQAQEAQQTQTETALAALRQENTALREQLDAHRAQHTQLRADFEGACTNLRHNNVQIEHLQSTLDYVKLRQDRAQRRTGAAGAAGVAETAALNPAPASSAPAEETQAAGQPAQSYNAIEYFDFENHFRGSIAQVMAQQRQYLPYFRDKQHVFDYGCGRGEFLRLMQENGIPAEGVDLYAPYVDYCTGQGLRAQCGDGTALLRQAQGVDGIFIGQVVEHLTPEQIVSLCEAAYDVLPPGGIVLAETPNPLSLSIYTNAFYIDPSHIKPVHPLTMRYYLEKAGFREIELIFPESSRPPHRIPPLSLPEGGSAAFDAAMAQVSDMLFGAQDYAIIGKK